MVVTGPCVASYLELYNTPQRNLQHQSEHKRLKKKIWKVFYLLIKCTANQHRWIKICHVWTGILNKTEHDDERLQKKIQNVSSMI